MKCPKCQTGIPIGSIKLTSDIPDVIAELRGAAVLAIAECLRCDWSGYSILLSEYMLNIKTLEDK